MQYRTLGRTGLRVSLLSFGTGGPSNFGQPMGLSQREQDALIRRCLDLGINLFDTSAQYRQSEEILGRALRGVDRDSFILVTKWLAKDGNGEMPADSQSLVSSVDRSLRRLRTDYVDVMMVHGPMPAQYHQVVERFYPEMKRLQEQGKIRFTGISVRYIADPIHEVGLLALKNHPALWDTVMLKYGILNQYAAKEALPLAMKHDVGIINMAAVRVKLPRPDQLEELIAAWKQHGIIPSDGLPASDPFGWLVHDDVDSVISAGYKFAADHPAIATVLTGTSNIQHMEKNAASLERPFLSESDKNRLIGLLGDVAEYA